MDMRKRVRILLDLESPWFIHCVVPIVSAGLGLPITISLLPGALGYGDADLNWGRIGVALLPTAFCALAGYLIMGLIFWLVPSIEEERDAG